MLPPRLKGQNAFVSLPTGFGKSLVYQVLPFCAERLLRGQFTQKTPVVVIVSPLVSLMYDQVAQLSSKNVRALCISGDQDAPLESNAASWSPEIRSDAYTAVEGRVTHVFGSPEAFLILQMAHITEDSTLCLRAKTRRLRTDMI